jgi:perosamine synthetase
LIIPVYEPLIGDDEVEAVVDAIRAGEISGSFGKNISAFESEFADFVGVRNGIAVSSGTAALQLAVQALDLEPGAEVLVSASTNIATALAAYHNGCVPVPVDSEPVTGNLNLELIDSLITRRTRAIVAVHLFGHPVDMDALMQLASHHRLPVIEDCAESHGAQVRGRMTGSFGVMSCFSFYANKVITTGEGGMVLTEDDELAERLRVLRNLAFRKPRFFHEDAGHNFRMTGFQAAMGRAQLRKIDHILSEKRRVAELYTRLLTGVTGIRTPVELPWATSIFWMYDILVEDDFGIGRDELITGLAEQGIESRTSFCPMNLQPFLQRQRGFRAVPCPVAEDAWRRGCYLPSSPGLSAREIEFVVEKIAELGQSRGTGQLTAVSRTRSSTGTR